MSDKISITVITSVVPRVLSKSFSLDSDGVLQKATGGNLSQGRSQTRRFGNMREFAAILPNLKPNQALMFGMFAHDEATVLSKKRAKRSSSAGSIVTRTRDCTSWPEGPAILMIDHDPPNSGDPLTGEELLERLFNAVPGLRAAPIVTRPSASSCIYRKCDGAELRGERGRRVYVGVLDGRDIERAAKVLQARLWLNGDGYITVSKSGSLLERMLVDGAVYQSERLDFAGGAACGEGLEQRLPAPEIINADAPFLDTATAFPNLTSAESACLAEIKSAARKEIEETARAAREAWIAERVEEFAATLDETDDEKRDQYLKDYEQTCRAAVEEGRLHGDFEIVLDDGKRVCVGEILDNPGKYHNRETLDPVEPDYDGGRAVGWLNLHARGRPYLNSFAHGGRRFTLIRARKTITLITGEEAEIFAKVAEILRINGELYERSGKIVRNIGNKIVLVCPDWLKLHLARNVRFIRFKKKKNGVIEEVAENAPFWLAQMMVRAEGECGFPNLRAVIDLPTLDPKTGRILADDGYDEQSGLLINLSNNHAVPVANAEVHAAQRAVEFLWMPFLDFPFADSEGGRISRGVFLACLLTAVTRRFLPTAPGFLISATAAGSGKTLLSQCVAALVSGDLPEVFGLPEGVSEEEMAKILLAKSLNGSATLLLDNLVGIVKSAALCSFLTSEIFESRILCVSATARVPTNTLVLLTGNQPVIAGDLNRRLLRCDLDPACEAPHKRRFELDPLEYVREHRAKMVSAALTILRAWHNVGRPHRTPDRLASFEAWSDTIRQAVNWVGEQGFLDVVDPALSIDSGFATDPDTRKLGVLLAAWRHVFGSARKPVKALRQYISCTDGALFDALAEIGAIERGELNPRMIGRWIEQRAGRIVDGLRFERAGVTDGAVAWQVVSIEQTKGFEENKRGATNPTPSETPCSKELKENDITSSKGFKGFASDLNEHEQNGIEINTQADGLKQTPKTTETPFCGSKPIPPWRRAEQREGRE